MKKKIVCLLLAFALLFSFVSVTVKAEEKKNEYCLGELYNTGVDTGYSERKPIDKEDPHYNWEMGDFFITGFTRQVVDNGTPVFLKNAGDEVALWFDLKQDISSLNGNEKLIVCEDENGYEETCKVEKQNLKKGTLIIKHTDYQNKEKSPQVYIDYLSAKVSKEADTKVMLCEEGDYEVSLLYEIKEDNFLFFDKHHNYRIDLKFSVRNGNTMVFPFDVVTGQELTDSVFTENGFYIDLANSKYLNVDIKREVLTESVDGLTEDIRFNRPATDGEKFVEEGIYTITVTNQYTKVSTEKKIYVGSNSLLKAHMVTGLSISEIKNKLADGKAEIDENGNIIPLSTDINVNNDFKTEQPKVSVNSVIVIVLCSALLVVALAIIVSIKYRKAKKSLNKAGNDL